MLQISDINQFLTFCSINFKLNDPQFNLLNADMAMAEILGTQEISMLNALKESGLKMYQGNSSFSKWKPKKVKDNFIYNDDCK